MEKQPGPCPICKMPLAKITIDPTQMNVIKLNAQQIKLAGIKTEKASISNIGKETILSGTFNINQNHTSQISSKIDGRIERLYHKITGEEIGEGEPVFDLYSRELLLTEEEFLTNLDKPNGGIAENMVQASKNKLRLWGLTETQISNLEKNKEAKITNTIFSKTSGTIIEIPVREGDFVKEGTRIYKLADLKKLWVEAQVYSTEIELLREGTSVEIIPESMPEEVMDGKISFSNPGFQNESKILLARIEVNNIQKKFKPGMEARIIHQTKEKKALVLPSDAVIRSGKHSQVWIQTQKGSFEVRMVETGIENNDKIEIVSGVTEGDDVVVKGAYLINSEYIFRKGMMPMGDMKM